MSPGGCLYTKSDDEDEHVLLLKIQEQCRRIENTAIDLTTDEHLEKVYDMLQDILNNIKNWVK